MARIPYIDPADAPDHVREVLDGFGENPLNIFKTLAHAESCFRPALSLGSAILTQQTLDHALRELAILRVARLSDAEYEWTQHVAIASAVGVTDEQIAALEQDDVRADCFSDVAGLVLEATTELVRDADVSDDTYAALSAHLSAREFVELVIAVGFYMLMARIMRAVRIDSEPAAGVAVLQRLR